MGKLNMVRKTSRVSSTYIDVAMRGRMPKTQNISWNLERRSN